MAFSVLILGLCTEQEDQNVYGSEKSFDKGNFKETTIIWQKNGWRRTPSRFQIQPGRHGTSIFTHYIPCVCDCVCIARFTHLKSLNASANASARKWKIFHFLHRRSCICVCVEVVQTCVYLWFHLRLRLRRSCELAL